MWLMPNSSLVYFIVLAEGKKVAQAEIKLFCIKYTTVGMNEYYVEI